MGKKVIATLAATVLLGLAASAQAAPMLPKTFAFYQKGSSISTFRQSVTFHMYFVKFRIKHGSWAPNINMVKMYTEGRQAGKPLPPPPWYKVLKGGGAGGSGGGGTTPPGPVKPPIPEPTSLALLGGGALFLIRRKREA